MLSCQDLSTDHEDLCRRPLDSHLANLECNSTSAVQITHHFLELMVTWVAWRGAVALLLTLLLHTDTE